MICYAFPLAHEAQEFLGRLRQRESFAIGALRCTLGNLGDRRVLAAQIGMGRELAARHTEAIFEHFDPGVFVLAGYGGGLLPSLPVGQIVVASNFSSPAALDWVKPLAGHEVAPFCTADAVIGTPAAREALARSTGGAVVEMEADAAIPVARRHGVPFLAVRAISDDFHHVLPMETLGAAFDLTDGRSTPLRLLRRLALHPGDIGPFQKLVRELFLARRRLTAFLLRLNEALPR